MLAYRFTKKAASGLLLCAMAGALATCGAERTESVQVPEQSAHRPTFSPYNDRYWKEAAKDVVLGDYGGAIPSTGDTYLDFLIQFDREKYEFRRRGLEYWKANPASPRRFSWLIISVALPPSYAVDSEAWAREEAEFGPNRYADFSSELEEWDAAYAEMRKEFWKAERVTEAQRRELWWAELFQEFERLRERLARGENIDRDAYMSELLEYVREFNKQLPEDRDFPGAYIGNLVTHVLDSPFGLEFNEQEKAALAAELEISGLPAIADRVRSGRIGFSARQRSAIQRLQDTFGTDNFNTELNWRDIVEADLAGPALIVDNLSFPLIKGTAIWESRAILWAQMERNRRQYLEQGLKLRDQFSTVQDETGWMNYANQLYPAYLKNALEGAFRRADRNYAAVVVDSELRDYIDAEFDGVIQSFFDDATNNDQRAYAWAQRLLRSYLRAGSAEGRTDTARSDLLRKIRHVHETYQHPFAVEFATGVASDSERFGFEVVEVREFFQAFLDDPDENMRTLAKSVLDPTSSFREPFSFVAPLLNGLEYDVSSKRGKYVLVDHWDTNCASCIAAFPRLQKVYEEYKAHGFEVVSIVYDGTSNRGFVERLIEEMNLTWPILDGEGQWSSVAAKYLYNGYPQYMLLDREGYVVAGREEVDHGRNLPALLDKYIPQQPLIWSVSDQDTVIYLYGTVHTLGDADHWFTVQTRKALAQSEIAYFEVDSGDDQNERLAAAVRQNVYLSEGQTLFDLLMDEQQELVAHAATESGAWIGDLKPLKPAYAAAELANSRLRSAGYSVDQTVDGHLEKIAGQNGTELRYFATAEEQLGYFGSVSLEDQVNYLLYEVLRTRSDEDGVDGFVEAWLSGDIATLEEEMIGDYPNQTPIVYEALLVDRNKQWVEELTRVMKEEKGSVFVAVGIGHLLGPDSLQAMLAEKGYVAKQSQNLDE